MKIIQTSLLFAIAAGIWVLVLQQAGIVSAGSTATPVRVVNDVSVKGVNEYGDLLDVNIRHVNGWPAANYFEYTHEGLQYHSLGVEFVPNQP